VELKVTQAGKTEKKMWYGGTFDAVHVLVGVILRV